MNKDDFCESNWQLASDQDKETIKEIEARRLKDNAATPLEEKWCCGYCDVVLDREGCEIADMRKHIVSM